MLNNVSVIINRADNSHRRLKILCAPTHEGYSGMLAHVPHDFHMICGEGFKQWDWHTRPMPKNHFLYTVPFDKMHLDQHFDLILSQERFNQLPRFQQIAQRTGIPLIHVDHTEPPPNTPDKVMSQLKAMRADKHVFITEHNKASWEGQPEDTVIRHGINHKLFTGWHGSKPIGLSMVNYIRERDVFCGWKLWENIASHTPIQMIGENPGLSMSLNNVNDIVGLMQSHRFFLNTSQLSPIPLSLLEAACCGMPIISTAKQEIPKIFTHGEDALLSNDPEDLKKYCTLLVDNKEMAIRLGANARKRVMELFNIDDFALAWNNLIWKTYRSV